jgi:hypothetical protein
MERLNYIKKTINSSKILFNEEIKVIKKRKVADKKKVTQITSRKIRKITLKN